MTGKQPKRFDAAASARVERMYQNPDIVAQRDFVRRHLNLQKGEAVMDVGAGPGFLAMEMANDVRPGGRVIALDPSADMRAIAEQRCHTNSTIDVIDGDAINLPAKDSSLDAIVATQVLEYVPDVAAAISDSFRALKPGGRLLTLDTDWNSAVMNTEDAERMNAVLKAWRSHFVHPGLPGRMPRLLEDAGFTLTYAGGTPVANVSMEPDQYAADMIGTIAKFAEKRGGVDPDVCRGWLQEQQDLATTGDFFFSITRFVFVATKPESDAT